MLHIFKKEVESKDLDVFTDDNLRPKHCLMDEAIPPETAYRLIKDELIDEGNPRQNLATFCQTYMEDEATKIMSESMAINAIDKSEYPMMTEIENRCVNIIADLWNGDQSKTMGTSTVGSSEATMLGGLAMKFRWRKLAADAGIDILKNKPNLVISSAYQVCWEKFCTYWDIEMREVPLDMEHMSINTDKVMSYVDDYTIGIVGILGITYNGKFDDIKKLDELVEHYNKTAKVDIGIHVDGASGGFFVPFDNPKLLWDFRLKNVRSISASGHKYGLVYPGIGWVLWKDKKYLPEDLIFYVNYLGGEQPTMAINFSRSGSQIIGQYYVFLRYGKNGLKTIQGHTKEVAMYLAKELKAMNLFKFCNEGVNIPIVCYELSEKHEWTLYDLSDRLGIKGWQIPAYTLPANLETVVIQRLVVRADLSMPLAESLVRDYKEAIEWLNKNPSHSSDDSVKVKGFTH